MRIRTLFVLLFVMVACRACSGQSPPEVNESTNEETKPLKGWAGLTFEQSFDDALSALPGIRWSSIALADCAHTMATDGCFLPSDRDSVLAPQDGIPFSPQLSFNKLGRLTDINLVYEQEVDSFAECVDLHERILDRLTKEQGNFYFPGQRAKEKAVLGWRREIRQTSGINRYEMSIDDQGNFVTTPMRSHTKGVSFPVVEPIPKWNDEAFVSLISSLIIGEHKTCRLDVQYSSRPSVLRRKM